MQKCIIYERTVKTSGESDQVYVNGVFSGGSTNTAKFSLYVSPYLVANQGGRYTKHIYAGSQRIVSKVGDFASYGSDPRRIENAVRTHLWVAIIAYLIIAKIKADYKSTYSITEVATLIRISALERVDLRDLITKPKDSTIQKQNGKELTLFDYF